MSFMESMGLHAEGFTDEEIARIDAIKDDLAHLLGVIKAEMPRINKVVPVIKMAADVVAAKQKGLR